MDESYSDCDKFPMRFEHALHTNDQERKAWKEDYLRCSCGSSESVKTKNIFPKDSQKIKLQDLAMFDYCCCYYYFVWVEMLPNDQEDQRDLRSS
jgi:hypothetical protein